MGLFGDSKLLNLNLELEKILGFNFSINVPTIDITNPLPKAINETKYFEINDDWSTLKVALEGQLNLAAGMAVGTDGIFLGDLLAELLNNDSLGFDVIIRTLEDGNHYFQTGSRRKHLEDYPTAT